MSSSETEKVLSAPQALLDVPASAEQLGVSERWMRRAIAERRIPFVKCGHLVRLRQSDLTAYIERQLVPAVGGET